MSQKHPLGGGSSPPPTNLKAEDPEKYSRAVREKLSKSSRTGQACDRCKKRKIKCDNNPGGCRPCRILGVHCQTTDRNNRQTAPRGYLNHLEQTNKRLEDRVRQLEAQAAQLEAQLAQGPRLPSAGPDHEPPDGYAEGAFNPRYAYLAPETPPQAWGAAAAATPYTSQATTSRADAHLSSGLTGGPVVRAEPNAPSFLGVTSGESSFSSIKGTSLKIFHLTIDIGDFVSPDMDGPKGDFYSQLFNKSSQSLLQTIYNVNHRDTNVCLPERDDGFRMIEHYFQVFNPYLPILHKPTFMAMATRMYDSPAFHPTPAETVMVYIVFAIMCFHYSLRKMDLSDEEKERYNVRSNDYYHFSLSMFYHLVASKTLQDIQALTLICSHLRSFPKPGASWMVARAAMTAAIEIDLHRSVTKLRGDSQLSPLDVEMRKRIFWSLLTIEVTISGKMGYPMAFKLEDFDIEIPDAIADEMLSEKGIDTSSTAKCQHEIGCQAMHIVVLFIELYSTIHAVRRNAGNYVSTVTSLEAKILAWQKNLPRSLTQEQPNQSIQERVFAIMTEMWMLEFRLLLRHPSVEMTDDRAFKAESLRICLECSKRMLGLVRQLGDLQSLDTTWYTVTVYVLAITTTLFATCKKVSLTEVEYKELKHDMAHWIMILKQQGRLLGSGDLLKNRVSHVILAIMRNLPHATPPSKLSTGNPPREPKLPRQPSAALPTHPKNLATYYDKGPVSTPYLADEPETSRQQPRYPAPEPYESYSAAEPSATLAFTHPHAYANYPATADDATLLAGMSLQAQAPPSHAEGGMHAPSFSAGQAEWAAWVMHGVQKASTETGLDGNNAVLHLAEYDHPNVGSHLPTHAGTMGPELPSAASWPENYLP
ncbi:hypothetical protein PZA11_004504 [Diplocarpon coronariae]